MEELTKGQVRAPEAGDQPNELKVQTDGIMLTFARNCRQEDLDATTLISYIQGWFKQGNFFELLVPIDKP